MSHCGASRAHECFACSPSLLEEFCDNFFWLIAWLNVSVVRTVALLSATDGKNVTKSLDIKHNFFLTPAARVRVLGGAPFSQHIGHKTQMKQQRKLEHNHKPNHKAAFQKCKGAGKGGLFSDDGSRASRQMHVNRSKGKASCLGLHCLRPLASPFRNSFVFQCLPNTRLNCSSIDGNSRRDGAQQGDCQSIAKRSV